MLHSVTAHKSVQCRPSHKLKMVLCGLVVLMELRSQIKPPNHTSLGLQFGMLIGHQDRDSKGRIGSSDFRYDQALRVFTSSRKFHPGVEWYTYIVTYSHSIDTKKTFTHKLNGKDSREV